MTPKPDCPDQQLLKNLLQDNLPDQAQADLEAHLETCVDCQQTLQGLAASDKSWGNVARNLKEEKPGTESEPALRKAVEGLSADAATTTLPREDGEGEQSDLGFLGPPQKPGSLGRLGSHEVLEVIGRGGMGIVLKALDDTLQRVVAIKVLAPHLAGSEISRKRFTREAISAAAVNHEYVVTIHSVHPEHTPPFLVMQLVSGVSLEEQVRRRQGPLEVAEIMRIGSQVAAGLAAAHARGLIHRDIKPANILLENGIERVKITDFGLARAADDVRLTQEGALAGTPQYMAPEQARGEAVDHRTDLFSLGSVLYTLCTGRAPFRGETMVAVLMNVCEKTPPPIRDSNPNIPEELVSVIDRLMAKNPADRFQNAQEVFDMLSGTFTRSPNLRPRFSVPVPGPRRPRQRPTLLPWLIATITVGVLFLCVVLGSAVGWNYVAGVVNRLFFPNSMQAQPTESLKKFTTNDKTLTQNGVEKHKDHWTITAKEPRTVKLFEVADPNVEKCTVFYQAKLKTENVQGKAYLQMWFRFPGKGEYFSKGLQTPVSGTTDWASYQIPFFLKEGERPDLIKLELVIEGTGTVSIKDIQLSKGPLPN